ncbi:hypothetical protein [Variovorax sp. MHTC-1]|uniref:hypothetical protein n=1 Tax=Variovorax sp. MHTC-1 TaxID=2495593 RepID=UPI000F87C5D9|nr:hypothetical protein [Variovorax sp. MHTC-1]
MLWMKHKATAQELRRELEAQYQSWHEQAERACRPESADGATDFGSLDGVQGLALSDRPGMNQSRG